MLGQMIFEDMSEILEALSVGVILIDRDSQVTFVNGQASALLGEHFEDVIAQPVEVVLKSEALHSGVDSVHSGVMDRVPVAFRLNDREIRATIYQVAPPGQADYAVLITLEDLSRFQELVDLKTEFISSLLHSLRTPMTTIKSGMSYLAAGDLGATTDTFFNEIVEMCGGEVNRLVEFLDDMRDLLLIEAGLAEHDLDEKVINATALVAKTVKAVTPAAQEKNISIVLNETDGPDRLSCDPRRFTLSLKKIIENAVVFSSEDSEVTVNVISEDGRLHVDVIDNGIGIPASEIDYIFEKHFRGRNEVTQRVTGNGLGLYIARFFMELMGGSVLVISAKGKGTKVKLAFPLSD